MVVYGSSVNEELVRLCGANAVSPRSRCKHAACLRHDVIYMLGGKDGNVPLCDVWSFNIETGVWTKITLSGDRLPSLQEHSVVNYQDELYIFGGSFMYGCDDEVPLWRVDVDFRRCVKLTSSKPSVDGTTSSICFPVGRRGHTSVVYGDSMFVYGGYIDMKGSSDELWQYNFDGNIWTLITSHSQSSMEFPVCRYSHSAVSYRRRMWIFGGLSDLAALDDLWAWHFETQRWTQIRGRLSPPALEGHSAAVVGNTMLVFGGCVDGRPQNSLWQFDFDFLTWLQLSIEGFVPSPCTQHCAIVVTRYHQSHRNLSMPSLRRRAPGVDVQRASTGRERSRLKHEKVSHNIVDLVQMSATETFGIELQRFSCATDLPSDASMQIDCCCDGLMTSLQRRCQIHSEPQTDGKYIIADVFNSSREQLIVDDTGHHNGHSTCDMNYRSDDVPCHGTDNPTFMTDDASRAADTTVSGVDVQSSHVVAARALMQSAPDVRRPQHMTCVEMTPYVSDRQMCLVDLDTVSAGGGDAAVWHDTEMETTEFCQSRQHDVREAWPAVSDGSGDRELTDFASRQQSMVHITSG